MKKEQKNNLEIHLINLSHALIKQLSQRGCILVEVNDSIEEDVVSTHHVAELLLSISNNPRIFEHYLGVITNWMFDPKNGVIDSQFSIDTLSTIAPNHKTVQEIIDKSILPTQLGSGAFTKYTAFLDGGDYFSTLWCVKVLQNTKNDKYTENINKAFDYLLSNAEDPVIAEKENLTGFLYLLLNKGSYQADVEVVSNFRKKLISFITNVKVDAQNLLTHLYIIEDLYSDKNDGEGIKLAEDHLVKILSLDSKVKGLPESLSSVSKEMSQSLYYHCLARTVVSGAKTFSDDELTEISLAVNQILHSNGRKAHYDSIGKDIQLKEYLSKYKGINEKFNRYNKQLEGIWKKSPFEKSVFIMMPFKVDRRAVNLRILTDLIKKACEEKGYKAIRADDTDRQLERTLWDNLVVNMLSCKYAVAVYFSEPVVDKLDENELKMFANPNVALEFGFFKSRGQEVLLLKDKESPIPTDLQGFLWNEFNINDPGEDVSKAVSKFLDNIESSLEKQAGAPEES